MWSSSEIVSVIYLLIAVSRSRATSTSRFYNECRPRRRAPSVDGARRRPTAWTREEESAVGRITDAASARLIGAHTVDKGGIHMAARRGGAAGMRAAPYAPPLPQDPAA